MNRCVISYDGGVVEEQEKSTIRSEPKAAVLPGTCPGDVQEIASASVGDFRWNLVTEVLGKNCWQIVAILH